MSVSTTLSWDMADWTGVCEAALWSNPGATKVYRLPSADCPSVFGSVEVSSAAPAWPPPVSAPPSAA